MSERGVDATPEATPHSDDSMASEGLVYPKNDMLISCGTSDHFDHDRDNDTGYDSEGVASACHCSSSSSSTQHAARDLFDEDVDVEEDGGEQDEEDDYPVPLNYLESSRTSISSLPASVIVRPASTTAHPHALSNELLQDYHIRETTNDTGYGTLRSLRSFRQREAAFRKPSSVRAMQMHSEDEDGEEYLTPTRHRGGGGGGSGISLCSPHSQKQRMMSGTSVRSAGSSPFKKSSYYSPNGPGTRPPPLKKEYPLVLLHCTLLAPTLSLPGMISTPSTKLLQEFLPARYWRRWKLLEEKLGSGVVRERGVLISHPQESYDLLEDRLLESLELQRPRLHHGHFLGQEEGVSEGEDASHRDAVEEAEDITDDENGDECPDCGTRIVKNQHTRRKWEIKVYAANGLMRAGAWAAAWKEMEKVDVEVGLWLPVDLRRELEKKILEHNVPEHGLEATGLGIDSTMLARAGSPDGSSLPRQNIDGCDDEDSILAYPQKEAPLNDERQPPIYTQSSVKTAQDIDIGTLLFNYVRVLASDRRNIALAVLGVLVVFFAVNTRPMTPDMRALPQHFTEDSVSTSIIAVTQTQQVPPVHTVQLERVPSVEARSRLSVEPSIGLFSHYPSAESTDRPVVNMGGERDPSIHLQRSQESILDNPDQGLSINQQIDSENITPSD